MSWIRENYERGSKLQCLLCVKHNLCAHPCSMVLCNCTRAKTCGSQEAINRGETCMRPHKASLILNMFGQATNRWHGLKCPNNPGKLGPEAWANNNTFVRGSCLTASLQRQSFHCQSLEMMSQCKEESKLTERLTLPSSKTLTSFSGSFLRPTPGLVVPFLTRSELRVCR